MKSATQLLTERTGAIIADERLTDHTEEPCAICAGPSVRGVPLDDFISDSLTDQNTFKALSSKHVCTSCVFVRARLSPVPGREPKPCDRCDGSGIEPAPAAGVKIAKRPKRKPGETCEKCDGSKVKESGGRFGNFSHFLDADRYENASKGQKPAILRWLRGPKRAPWFCAIADSGQKHVLPYAPVNPGVGRGRVRFEEQEVQLPGHDGFVVVDEMTELLTAGVTKDELQSGQYTARGHALAGSEWLRTFEETHGGGRGGTWFALAVWLAQRDEERVAVRLETEKQAKATKDEVKRGREKAGRTRAKTRATKDILGRNAYGVSPGVSPDVGCQPIGALAHPARSDAGSGALEPQRRRVGDASREVSTDPTTGQVRMFDFA